MKSFLKKTIFAVTAFLFGTLSLFAQGNPVEWKFDTTDLGDGLFELSFTATIGQGWHIYDFGPYESGPDVTAFTFDCPQTVELVGDTRYATEPHRAYDEMFGMEIGTFEDSATFVQQVRATASSILRVNVEWMCCNIGSCLPPDDRDFIIRLELPADVADEAPVEVKSAEDAPRRAGKPLWGLIVEAILWGLAALATPCVFPMIPMTVSYFIKGPSGRRAGRFRAFMYGIFIVLLYTLPIALIIALTRIIGGDAVTADIFNWLSTHWLPNIIFFLVFMTFAASFFGAFELVLPGKVVNGSDSRSNSAKGLGGVFFMALTLVLVSFSCTGPIVGTVLIKSVSGEFLAPMVTMLAFSAAFALPFTLFALFPSWLKKLPRSGGWLNSVKVVLGFIEIALGFKFLSTADQTYQWGLLDREVYLAIWIVCFSMLGFYLLGKLRFRNDDPVEHISVTRLALAIAAFSFVVYMIPGMWGAPLKAISGYLPPIQTQDFVLGSEIIRPSNEGRTVKYGDSTLEIPLGLDGFFDIAEAEQYADKVGKPLFIDFTGLGCMNCREMEARVLSDPEILRMLRDNYVYVALFGDDKRTEVAPQDWVTTDSGKTLKTLGKINSWYMMKEYGISAQPCYILKGHGRTLLEPRAYDLDVQAFRNFLRKGLEEFENQLR